MFFENVNDMSSVVLLKPAYIHFSLFHSFSRKAIFHENTTLKLQRLLQKAGSMVNTQMIRRGCAAVGGVTFVAGTAYLTAVIFAPAPSHFVSDELRQQRFEKLSADYESKSRRQEFYLGLSALRGKIINEHVGGTVLEVGAGTGHNISHYVRAASAYQPKTELVASVESDKAADTDNAANGKTKKSIHHQYNAVLFQAIRSGSVLYPHRYDVNSNNGSVSFHGSRHVFLPLHPDYDAADPNYINSNVTRGDRLMAWFGSSNAGSQIQQRPGYLYALLATAKDMAASVARGERLRPLVTETAEAGGGWGMAPTAGGGSQMIAKRLASLDVQNIGPLPPESVVDEKGQSNKNAGRYFVETIPPIDGVLLCDRSTGMVQAMEKKVRGYYGVRPLMLNKAEASDDNTGDESKASASSVTPINIQNILFGQTSDHGSSDPLPVPIALGTYSTEQLPFPDNSFDTVIDVFSLCSYDHPTKAVAEMARVCKPGGKIIFFEHGKGSNTWVNRYLDKWAIKHADHWGCWWNRDMRRITRISQNIRIESRMERHFGTSSITIATPLKPE